MEDVAVPPAHKSFVPGKRQVGLSSEAARKRLLGAGPNEIRRERATPAWRILARQFKGAMVLLLLAAGVLSLALNETADAIAIGVILIINGLIGFFQEFRAERAVLALRSMTASRARVLRDGMASTIPSAEVVVGDVLLLEAGDVVAADARLLEAHVLRTLEAPLTGESTPVEKSAAPVPPETPLAERSDAVFLGTSIAAGTGVAEVFATGMETELGRIAHLLAQTSEEKTPLQHRLERVGSLLLYLCLAIVAVVGLLGIVRGQAWQDVVMSSVSLAVAAVPEGLAAVVTIALALGIQRMAVCNVLIRRLTAVETLGCATVICTDKTGTLTTGIMAVRELWGQDYGELLRAAAACCDARLSPDGHHGAGDPTEIAILVAAAERGIEAEALEQEIPRVDVNPFDTERKRMSILRSDGVLYLKGAVEVVLPCCIEGTDGALEANADMTRLGLRVLAVAVGNGPREEQLRLVGLIGIADPPRTEAIEAVAHARAAGIRTVMITGDHPSTAEAIARELGILLNDQDASEIVHARATPEDKLRIIRAWKQRGEIVAMTGDGVNDAPALREAHIGIAMGRSGTEVTRESADMILTDDNFSSIISAVQEGRGVYDNIRKTLVFLLTGNFGELAVMLGASIVGLPLPLLPMHLLWINLVTDGLPALALVADPTSDEVLRRPPRRPEEPLLGAGQWKEIAIVGVLEAALALGGFLWLYPTHGLETARELAFSVIVFVQLFRALASRSSRRIYWEVGVLSNLWLLGVVVFSVALQIALRYIPLTRELLHLGTLSLHGYLVAVLLGLIPMTLLELSKLIMRRRNGPQKPVLS